MTRNEMAIELLNDELMITLLSGKAQISNSTGAAKEAILIVEATFETLGIVESGGEVGDESALESCKDAVKLALKSVL